MALPWLESLPVWGDEPKAAKASDAPVRFAALFAGNGFHSKEWWARGQGDKMELGKVLAPLAPFRKKLLFIRGLYNAEALKGNIHSSQTGNLLSGAPLASGGEIRSGTSIDQLLAQRYGRLFAEAESAWIALKQTATGKDATKLDDPALDLAAGPQVEQRRAAELLQLRQRAVTGG